MKAKWNTAVHYMAYTDLSATDIAKEMGLSHQTIYNWRNNPEFQELLDKELDIKTKILRNRFKKDADKVYERVYDIAINSDDESTSLNAGKFLIENVLGKAPSSVNLKATQDVQINKKVNEKDILDIFEKEID